MSVRVFDCPQCGAPVSFRSAIAVFAVCEHCRSMVVVRDAGVESIGEMAALPPDLSPFQVGTRGEWQGHGFEIVGRVRVEWKEGSWNEWCILYDGAKTGWLAEAQGLLMISFAVEPPEKLPAAASDYSAGAQVRINGADWTINDIKDVTCRASEGELPMHATPASRRTGIDLFGGSAAFASIELSDSGTDVYVGEYAAFDELKFSNLRPVPGWNAEVAEEKNRTVALACPSCGAPVQLRAAGLAMSAVCGSCGVVIDTATPQFRVIQKADIASRNLAPRLTIGARGKLFGVDYEIIGFVKREDRSFSWHEYLLFNPWQGFRWLVTFEGHWSFIDRVPAMPNFNVGVIEYGGREYRFFSRGRARVAGVLGEFYWKIHRGEEARVFDYIAPPYILSKEVYFGMNEFTWSQGQYVASRVIGQAFGIPDLPPAQGIYLNQPSPYAVRWQEIRLLFIVVLLTLIGTQFYFAQHRPEVTVLNAPFTFDRIASAAPSVPRSPQDVLAAPNPPSQNFSSPHFTLAGDEQRVVVEAQAAVENTWLGLDLNLVNARTNQSYPAGVEVSYYHGADEDGPWSEGGQSASVSLPAIPPGEYYLTLEASADPQVNRLPFDVRVQAGGLFASNFIVVLGLVLFYPAMLLWRRYSFEKERWSDADTFDAGGTDS
jgi:uncharacterized protein (DUF983 family)